MEFIGFDGLKNLNAEVKLDNQTLHDKSSISSPSNKAKDNSATKTLFFRLLNRGASRLGQIFTMLAISAIIICCIWVAKFGIYKMFDYFGWY